MNKVILTFFILMLSFCASAAKDDEFKDMYTCFRINLIKVEIENDRVRWPGSSFTNVCSINLAIDSANTSYFYYSRGWRYPELCEKFVRDWNELKKKNMKVCIAARLDPFEKIPQDGKKLFKRSTPYEVIKSGKWCHSYFAGYCD